MRHRFMLNFPNFISTMKHFPQPFIWSISRSSVLLVKMRSPKIFYKFQTDRDVKPWTVGNGISVNQPWIWVSIEVMTYRSSMQNDNYRGKYRWRWGGKFCRWRVIRWGLKGRFNTTSIHISLWELPIISIEASWSK